MKKANRSNQSFPPLDRARFGQVMALGDRVRANRQGTAAVSQLVAALGDSDDSIRLLAGSALKILSGLLVTALADL